MPLIFLLHGLKVEPPIKRWVCSLQAALDAMAAYYDKVKAEQQVLEDKLIVMEQSNRVLQMQLRELQQEHALCNTAR